MDEKIIGFVILIVLGFLGFFYIQNNIDKLEIKVEKYCSENGFKNINYDTGIGRFGKQFKIGDRGYCYNEKLDGNKLYFNFSK